VVARNRQVRRRGKSEERGERREERGEWREERGERGVGRVGIVGINLLSGQDAKEKNLALHVLTQGTAIPIVYIVSPASTGWCKGGARRIC
jgi:hypothetical protein